MVGSPSLLNRQKSPGIQVKLGLFVFSTSCMGYKVHVYMKQPPSHVAIDVGEAEFSLPPVLMQQISFEHQGKVETGLIERIDPPDWKKRGAVPEVYVVLSPGE